MNREIKFRAWEKEIKKMYYRWNHELFKDRWMDNYNFEFLQYTWLLDKEWKEVYEGDIIEWPIEWWTNSDSTLPEKNNNIITIDDITNLPVNNSDWSIAISEYKIIWNIYENPDLLEDNKPNE
jgi:uncharacterized phage protein (TIGR01671 family)